MSRNSIYSSIIAGLLLFVIQQGYSQAKFDTLTNRLNHVFKQDSLPGMSVILVNAGGIVYHQDFGFADRQNNIPYTSATIQNVGSVSKTFIAVALMKAIELKYFTLETDINDILPFKVVNPNYPEGKITIRELANHSSGIIDNPAVYPNTYKFHPDLRPYDKDALDALQSIGYRQSMPDSSLAEFFYNYLSEKGKYYGPGNFGKGGPGSTSSYSNTGSALVAYLIEIKAGIPYADFVKKFILSPLKMKSSTFFIANTNLEKHARLYYKDNLAFPLYDLVTYPDGGLKTSPTDLAKYVSGLIKGYNGDELLLKNESYKQMFTAQFSKEHPPKDINLTYRNKGIFWNLYTNGTIGHDGDDPGISAFVFFNPATNMGGLFMCNRYLPDKKPIIDLLVQATSDIKIKAER